ncbi:MAG: DNA ligase [Desulfobulbaceae bacterium]|nr:DNA ligase [Desulfobulbaceae bacterium]
MGKKLHLTAGQKHILKSSFEFSLLSEEEVVSIASGLEVIADLSDGHLVEFLQIANLLYRSGDPLIDDALYDFSFLEELKRRHPDHSFLHSVEPEAALESKTVELPVRMLSTEKAYDFETMARWAKRIAKVSMELGIQFSSLLFRATPKLDGYAAYDDGQKLYTRGDGRRGTDITRAFDRGLKVASGGERGLGAGEVVVCKSYFENHLAAHFDNSRNFQASLIKEKELEPPAAKAIELGQAMFYPFSLLPSWEGRWQEVEQQFETIVNSLWEQVDFDIDGIVFEITNSDIKNEMGATRHHHRWQIAYKRNTETAEVRVLKVLAQTSRSGRVNPVAEIEPTRLSGALIRRATAHHYGMVQEKGIGPGALIRLSRSGEVIPKIEQVLEGVVAELPESCPSCGASLTWESDYLQCGNVLDCPAQITNSIEHFFKVLGNIDGFGPSSIKKIYDGGVERVSSIYALREEDFVAWGFGPKQAENMVAQLQRSLSEPIEDWRFLAAFGVHRMGMGNCEKLLSVYPLEQLFGLDEEQIIEVKGFSEKIAQEILSGLCIIREEFDKLYSLGFNLIITAVEAGNEPGGLMVLAGKLVVFTGTMRQGNRNEMKKQAKTLGAKVGSSITGKTDILVCGEKVGAAKLKKAEELGIEVMNESDYIRMITV